MTMRSTDHDSIDRIEGVDSRSRIVRPYGSWPSPITADLVVQRGVTLTQIATSGDELFWSEGRPLEDGRHVIVRAAPGRAAEDVLPPGFSACTRVHEYGGGAYAVHHGIVWFSNWDDQRIYRLDPGSATPRPITPDTVEPGVYRYADACVHPDGTWLVCVRERHEGDEVINDLVAIDAGRLDAPRVIASGRDFYAAPRFSPDGRRLAWICWDHPNMPWDGTELWLAGLDGASGVALHGARRLAGGASESIAQPRWSPGGQLYFVSDRTGWWNLYAADEATEPLVRREAEFSGPDWMFGQSTYACLPDGRLIAACSRHAISGLVVIDPRARTCRDLDTPYTAFASIHPYRGGIVAIAASATAPAAIVHLIGHGSGEVVRQPSPLTIPREHLSTVRHIEFPSIAGGTAHALFYPPTNPEAAGPVHERPPLISMTHGGPTYMAVPALSTAEEGEDAQGLNIHFWTSRGFAVVDVNYSGSSGFGRAYRDRLHGQWGIVDVHDCISAARALVERRDVDGERLIIRGGSAGGYVALCGLTFHQLYAAGASYFGVADLDLLAAHPHKFESRYIDWLAGPAGDDRWRRSPVHFADRLSAPLIILQGLDDEVVPPSQAEVLVAALRARGLPFAYLTFDGEGHGFRRAASMRRALEAELAFYGRVLGFTPADALPPILVENLPR
jgi:dipeptidyl aminopeptidase/acylaminoacyl peptidase